MGWNGVLALTLVVRDEEEILEANLDHHLAQGVDVILAVDHGSSDGTPQILARYARAGLVKLVRDEERAIYQPERVTELLRIADQEYGADWVIHCDADEFWMPAAGSLRDVFGSIPDRYGYVQIQRHDFLPPAERSHDQDNGSPFYERMLIRRTGTLNAWGVQLQPKVAGRPSAAPAVGRGNHDLVSPVMEQAPDIGALDVLHFPIRDYEQFERRVLRNGVGHEQRVNRPPNEGLEALGNLEIYRRGELPDYFRRARPDDAEVERGLELGELLVDRRLQESLAKRDARMEESPAVQELLRSAWELAARASEQQSTLAAVGRELERTQAVATELGAVLDEVRASRLMRYTAPARRTYYKLRRRLDQRV